MAVIIPITSTFNPKGVQSAEKAFKGLSKDADKLGKSVSSSSNLMKTALAAVSAGAVIKGLQSSVMAASNLSESIAKSNTVFGKNAKQIEEWSKTTSKALGVSQQSALEAAGTYGNLFRAFGINEQESAKMSKALVTLAADLASFNNVPIEDALLALRSGLSGETEPLKRFGIALNEARLKEEALRLGLIKTTKGTLPQAIKTQAAYALILKDSALAQGDVSRTADGLANQLKFLEAGLKDAKAGFGQVLLPAVLSIVSAFNEKLLPAIERVVTAIQLQGAEGGLKTIGVEISNVITNLTGTAKAVKDLILVFIGIKTVIPLVAALQTSWTAVTIAIGATATATQIAAGVMKRALISTGIGALIVAAGFVVGKFIDMRIQANATDKTIRVLESNGVQAMTRFGNVAALANEKVQRNIVSLNAVQLAATRAGDALDNAGILDVKRGKIPVYNPVAVPGIADVISVGSAGTSKKAEKKAKEAAKAAEAMAKLIANSTKSATSALTKMNNKLTTARDKLQVAKDAYKSYRNGVKEAIISQFSFTSVLDTFTDRQDEAKEASQKLAEAQLRYKDALKNPKDVEKIADALKELTAAQTANANATKNKKTFLQVMRDQATAAVAFASKVKKLMVMGLSKAGLDQVIAAGADAGTAIADELIAGGASAIKETNTLLKSVESAAQVLGKATADQFFKTGVTQGEQMVAGIVSAIKKAGFIVSGGQVKLPKKLQKALDSGKLSDAQVTELNTLLKGVPKLANGGVVNKPTLAMIGEAGPEAVIPLSGRNAGMGTVYNINVNAGIGTNGAQVGRDIVDAIKKYERASGPVFASA
jgi:hypothetical protein